MTKREDTENYKQLFLEDIPLLDVRAPIEFNQGAFPNTQNEPLLDDKQRELIGTKYKDAGQDEAIALGAELITPELKAYRQQHWKAFCEKHPQGYLYCFRGGLRSRITQTWLQEAGCQFPYVKGGYKALRRFLIDQFEQNLDHVPFIRVAGRTGSGKTHALLKIEHHIDLEGIAQHRGSAFGRNVTDTQPTQINFENQISIDLLKHKERHPNQTLFVEDEGRMIGRCVLTEKMHKKMVESPSIIIHESLETRVDNITQDYVDNFWPTFKKHYAEEAEQQYSDFVLHSLSRVQKRLGLERYKKIEAIFQKALKKLFMNDDSSAFEPGFEILLSGYYDPMYDYQMTKRQGAVLFEGDSKQVVEWANQY